MVVLVSVKVFLVLLIVSVQVFLVLLISLVLGEADFKAEPLIHLSHEIDLVPIFLRNLQLFLNVRYAANGVTRLLIVIFAMRQALLGMDLRLLNVKSVVRRVMEPWIVSIDPTMSIRVKLLLPTFLL